MHEGDDRSYYERISDIARRTSTSLPRSRRGHWPITGGEHVGTIIKVAVVLLLLALPATYAGDYIAIRYRMVRNRSAFGTVRVDVYYAIQQKGNKTEFTYAGSQDQTCVNSLFSHFGSDPCWYLRRHTDKRIEM